MSEFAISLEGHFFFGRLPNLSDAILMLFYAAASLTLGFFVFDRLRDTLAEAI